MDGFVPEPGFGSSCIQCGGDLPKNEYGYKGDTQTGLCRECTCRGKTNKGSKRQHIAYWGYNEKAHRIVEHNKAKRDAA